MSEFEGTKQNSCSEIAEDIVFEIPPDCGVVFYNDNFTTKDFVVDILVSVFGKSEGDAVSLMELVHKTGSAVVGVYTYDIAVTRANIAINRARKQEFPLRVEVKRI